MTRWTCAAAKCSSVAVGCGGAIGLRAIGWQFVPRPHQAPILLCPGCRTDGVPGEVAAIGTQQLLIEAEG